MKRLPLGYSFRNDGRYQCRFTYNGEQHCVYGRTIEECEAKKNERIELLKSGLDVDNQNITLAQYYEIWLEEQKKAVKKSSIYSYKKYWKYINREIGDKKIAELKKIHVLRMQSSIKDNHTVDTANRSLKLLSSILKSAVDDRIVGFNIASTVKKYKSEKPKASETNHRALTLEEQDTFFSAAKDTHYYNLYCLLINTGMRVSEALALTWSDIDWKKREISITKTVMRTSDSGWEVSRAPKTENSNRRIPITPVIEDILLRQKLQNSSLKILKFNGFIFTTDQGEMSNYNNVDSAIRRLLAKMSESGNNIEHISSHAFRATFATRCIEQGMQPKTLQAILGHSSLKMTMDLYAHVLPNTKAEELSKVVIAI